MKVIDLFCGAGGSSTGIEQAGHEVILAVDIDKTTLESYKTNHPDTEILQADILKLKPKDLHIADRRDTIILGSTPCQTFSHANTYNRSCDMTLTRKFFEIIENIKPKYWILENLVAVIKHLPYQYRRFAHKLNAVNYGTPQNRTRMIAGNYPTPRITHTEWPNTTFDGPPTEKFVYLSDVIPELKGKWLCDQRTTKPGPGHSSFFHADRPSRTVTSKQFAIIKEPKRGAKKGRYLTIEEHALIQGFPSGYVFIGNKGQKQRQVANAVPPQILKAIGSAIIK